MVRIRCLLKLVIWSSLIKRVFLVLGFKLVACCLISGFVMLGFGLMLLWVLI